MGALASLSRWNKLWILATFTSLALYAAYWVQSVYNWIYLRLQENLPNLLAAYPNFYIDHVASAFADTFRLIAVILIFIAAYLAWGPPKRPFYAVKKYVAVAILLEALYWLIFLPYNIQCATNNRPPVLMSYGFVFQILAAGPLLVVLSFMVWTYKEGSRVNLVKWGCIAGIGYIFGMWINYLLRWLGQSGLFGVTDPRLTVDLFRGITSLGFLNLALTLTLSLVFAVAGSYVLIKQNRQKRSTQILGLAILLFGLYFALYILYCWFAPGTWRFVLLTEIWPAPILGVGIGLLNGRI